MKKPKTYTRRQVWNILKKWNKESKEPYSVADRFGLHGDTVEMIRQYQALKEIE